jgi:hypothetical protein
MAVVAEMAVMAVMIGIDDSNDDTSDDSDDDSSDDSDDDSSDDGVDDDSSDDDVDGIDGNCSNLLCALKKS